MKSVEECELRIKSFSEESSDQQKQIKTLGEEITRSKTQIDELSDKIVEFLFDLVTFDLNLFQILDFIGFFLRQPLIEKTRN